MSPIKQILHQMQENEKKYNAVREPESLESAEPLIKEYIQYLKKTSNEAVSAFAECNMNLNLCKTFLSKLIESNYMPIKAIRDIKEFLDTLNNKNG